MTLTLNPNHVAEMREDLERAATKGASERTLDRKRVAMHLAELALDGIVTSAYRSNGRYLITARGFRGERAYTLREVEAFIHGCDAARNR